MDNNTERSSLIFTSLQDSIAALGRSLDVLTRENNNPDADDALIETLGSGVIQNFETAYEQSWKAMKRWLEENIGSTLGMERIQFFRFAAENGLINDVAEWMKFHKSRNETSHTYDGDTAHDVIAAAYNFLPYSQELLARLTGEQRA